MYCEDSSPTVIFCTITQNEAASMGAGLSCWNSTVGITSSILFANQAPTYAQAWVSGGSYPSVLAIAYSDVESGEQGISVEPGGTLIWGDGNIDSEPRFVDSNGPDDDPNTWEDNDYRLGAGSPCVDAGDGAAAPLDSFDVDDDGDTGEPIPFDLDGSPRFVDDPGMPDCGNGTPPIVDMGAYEFQGATCFGDLDGDGEIALSDLAQLLGHYGITAGASYEDGDFDCDGDVDLAELAALLGVYGTTCE